MHLDICSSGTALHKNQEGCHLLNAIFNLTQFIISSITTDTKAESLAKLFMEEGVLSFGMVSVVVLDADSRFRGSFEEMCKCLQITLWNLASSNNKGNSVEKYHRFLNKTQAIVGKNRGSHDVLILDAKTSQYAWNSAPINDTDMMHSVADVGR